MFQTHHFESLVSATTFKLAPRSLTNKRLAANTQINCSLKTQIKIKHQMMLNKIIQKSSFYS